MSSKSENTHNHDDIYTPFLTEDTTINISYGSTGAEINALLATYPMSLKNRYTIQFEDCPHKYFNGSTDTIVGNGSTTTVTLQEHGFSNGDEIHLAGFVNGTYHIPEELNNAFIISLIDENTFTISSSYSGSITPSVNAIAVKVWDITDEDISFANLQRVVDNIIDYALGNTSESNYSHPHNTQRVVLKTSKLKIDGYIIKNIAIVGGFMVGSTRSNVVCCYVYGTGTGISYNFMTANDVTFVENVTKNNNIALKMSNGQMVSIGCMSMSDVNYGHQVVNGGIIAKRNGSFTGTIADDDEELGLIMS